MWIICWYIGLKIVAMLEFKILQILNAYTASCFLTHFTKNCTIEPCVNHSDQLMKGSAWFSLRGCDITLEYKMTAFQWDSPGNCHKKRFKFTRKSKKERGFSEDNKAQHLKFMAGVLPILQSWRSIVIFWQRNSHTCCVRYVFQDTQNNKISQLMYVDLKHSKVMNQHSSEWQLWSPSDVCSTSAMM